MPADLPASDVADMLTLRALRPYLGISHIRWCLMSETTRVVLWPLPVIHQPAR